MRKKEKMKKKRKKMEMEMWEFAEFSLHFELVHYERELPQTIFSQKSASEDFSMSFSESTQKSTHKSEEAKTTTDKLNRTGSLTGITNTSEIHQM
jgi:hypothetical protein